MEVPLCLFFVFFFFSHVSIMKIRNLRLQSLETLHRRDRNPEQNLGETCSSWVSSGHFPILGELLFQVDALSWREKASPTMASLACLFLMNLFIYIYLVVAEPLLYVAYLYMGPGINTVPHLVNS